MVTKRNAVNVRVLHRRPRPVRTVFITVNNNNLVSNVTTCIGQLQPRVGVVNMRPVRTSTVCRSLGAKRQMHLDRINLFTSKITIHRINRRAFHLYRRCMSSVVLIDASSAYTTVGSIFRSAHSVLRPTKTLTVTKTGTCMRHRNVASRALVTMTYKTGVGFSQLQFITRQTRVNRRQRTVFTIAVPRAPKDLGTFYRYLNAHGLARFGCHVTSGGRTRVFINLRIRNHTSTRGVVRIFRSGNLGALSLASSRLSGVRLHRVMNNGSTLTRGRLVCQFRFPRQPNTLVGFIDSVDPS